MITFSIVKDIILRAGSRILKVQELGPKTADQVSSFGDDSSPVKDMAAIYANTSEVGDNIIIGYINKNQISKPGEKRIFSLKPDGSLSFEIHLKDDGTCSIGPNATDNAVRFSQLKIAFDQLRTDFNALVTAYNAHQHAAPAGASPPTVPGSPSTADVSGAKIDQINII